MLAGSDISKGKVPSLVYICQRVAANHAESISNLGSELSFDLVKPILERCNGDQLARLEEASPHIQPDTPGIWKEMCFQKYRLIAEEHYSLDDDPQEPDSWRNRYFLLQEAEIKRIEEVGLKIRSQRKEADERKKEREVRFTDRVPPPKRPRTGGWGVPVQPKTLFQKTRSEASKLHKAFYNSRTLPPRQIGKTTRVHATPDDSILPAIPKLIPGRVTVNTVTVPRRIPPSSSSSASSPASASSSRMSPPSSSFDTGSQNHCSLPKSKQFVARPSPSSPPNTQQAQSAAPSSRSVSSSAPPTARPTPVFKSPAPLKKDPMACLFVPKHRAYSQRPVS